MNETIIIILIAFGIGNQIEKQKPEEILYKNSDGSLVSTLIHKGNYYCPIYCSTDHKHFSHKIEKKCNLKSSCNHFVHNEQENIVELLDQKVKDVTIVDVENNK